eukprot:scaffold26758_cov64-Phaeocystis_antarctica.AAC.5
MIFGFGSLAASTPYLAAVLGIVIFAWIRSLDRQAGRQIDRETSRANFSELTAAVFTNPVPGALAQPLFTNKPAPGALAQRALRGRHG